MGDAVSSPIRDALGREPGALHLRSSPSATKSSHVTFATAMLFGGGLFGELQQLAEPPAVLDVLGQASPDIEDVRVQGSFVIPAHGVFLLDGLSCVVEEI
jgi:hypothetical protein